MAGRWRAYFRFWRIISLVPITIELPDLTAQIGFNLARWTEILGDPYLAKLPDRIETNRHGHILMTPPPGFRHSERQGQIIALLIQFASQGRTLPECPISTADGVKAIDVGWLDAASRDEIGQDIPLLTRAPEIASRSSPPPIRQPESLKNRLSISMPGPPRSGSATAMAPWHSSPLLTIRFLVLLFVRCFLRASRNPRLMSHCT